MISILATDIDSTSAVKITEARRTNGERSAIQISVPPKDFATRSRLLAPTGSSSDTTNSIGFFVKAYATDSEKPGASYKFAPHFAHTLQELNDAPDDPLSDHRPITVDIPLSEPPLKSIQQ
jgi:hypothetical protein